MNENLDQEKRQETVESEPERNHTAVIRVQQFISQNRRQLYIIFLLVLLEASLMIFPASSFGRVFRALVARRVIVALFLGFTFVMLSLLWSVGEVIDQWLFLLFNLRGRRSRWIDLLMWGLTQIGNMVTALVLSALVYAGGYHLIAVEIVLGMISLWLVVEFIKMLIERERPYLTLMETRVVGRQPLGLSFPSGHTSQTFFLMTLLVQTFRLGPFNAFFLYILAFLVGITRMYVGAHYPRDVIGGAMLGTVWGLMTSMLHFYLLGLNH